MIKQVVVGNCRECPFAWYEYLQMIPGWKCSHFEMHCRVSGEGIHPDCPLPDVQQPAAASPWRPMSDAPKNGMRVLGLAKGGSVHILQWKFDGWVVENMRTFIDFVAFAYINKPEGK